MYQDEGNGCWEYFPEFSAGNIVNMNQNVQSDQIYFHGWRLRWSLPAQHALEAWHRTRGNNSARTCAVLRDPLYLQGLPWRGVTSQWKVHSGPSGAPLQMVSRGHLPPSVSLVPPGHQSTGGGERRRSGKCCVRWRCPRGLVQVFFLDMEGFGGGGVLLHTPLTFWHSFPSSIDTLFSLKKMKKPQE